MHFLAGCCNFYKSVQPGLRGSNDLRFGRKMATFQLFFFSVQRTDGSPTGSDPENGEDDENTGSTGRPVSSGLQVPGEPGLCARTRPPWLPSRGVGVYPSKVLQLNQQRWVIIRVDSVAFCKIINEEVAVWIQKIETRTFLVDFCTRNFWGRRGAEWAAIPTLHSLFPCLLVIVI